MQHTYLRYECADSFSLSHHTTSTASSSSSIAFLNNTLLSTASSQIIAYDLRRGLPLYKIAHYEESNIGTGKALNSSNVICIDTNNSSKVGSGWSDGSVRVFSLSNNNSIQGGLVRSLIHKSHDIEALSDPLTLNGHSCPVHIVKFDNGGTRLASGSADGVVILWDVVAESGLFRLLGHTGPVSGIEFLIGSGEHDLNGLVTSGSDGKVFRRNKLLFRNALLSHTFTY